MIYFFVHSTVLVYLQDTLTLETTFDDAKRRLDKKMNETATARDRADSLRQRADKLAQATGDKIVALKRE